MEGAKSSRYCQSFLLSPELSGTALVSSSLLVGDVCYRAPSQQFPALIGNADNRPNDGRSVLVPVLRVDPGLGHGGRVHLLRAGGTQVWRLDLFQLCSGFRGRRCSTGEDIVQTNVTFLGCLVSICSATVLGLCRTTAVLGLNIEAYRWVGRLWRLTGGGRFGWRLVGFNSG